MASIGVGEDIHADLSVLCTQHGFSMTYYTTWALRQQMATGRVPPPLRRDPFGRIIWPTAPAPDIKPEMPPIPSGRKFRFEPEPIVVAERRDPDWML